MSGGYGSRVRFLPSFLKKFIWLVYPPAPFVNVISFKHRRIIKEAIFTKETVLDVGSGVSRGPGSWLWKNVERKQYAKLDIVTAPDIDIVASALNMPMDSGTIDAIILQSVPEHINDITLLFKEAHRVLKFGGLVYIEMPFLQGKHGDPDDYWRCTPAAIDFLLKDKFSIVVSGVSAGPMGALIWIFSDLCSNILPFRIVNLILRFVLRWALSPLRYLDKIFVYTKAASRLSAENYFLYRKN
ncbi:class I SAM-dependent methyltransferase [bacterium]|nr:class I SAM-dependent methyltransferase [bacterium]